MAIFLSYYYNYKMAEQKNNNFINNMVNKIKLEKKYNIKYDYTKNNEENKIIYKIIMKKGEVIKINKDFNYVSENENVVVKILYNIKNNINNFFVDSILIKFFDNIFDIDYTQNNCHDLSIIIPVSILDLTHHSLINFDFMINKLLKMDLKINICLSHTEKYYNTFMDDIINNNSVNYIFILNTNIFCLGYNRNLWKYISNSNKIMFLDIDVPIGNDLLKESIKESLIHDIVKPYDKKLFRLGEEEKYLYINDKLNEKDRSFYPLTITGGIILFDKHVLKETGGYDEFYGYGYEDRNLDVIILEKKYKIKKLDFTIYHLFHESVKRSNKFIMDFSLKYYNCEYNQNIKNDIHELCDHNHLYLNYLIEYKKKYNGNISMKKNIKEFDAEKFNNLVEIPDFSDRYITNLFIKEHDEQNNLFLKQIASIKYLDDNLKLSDTKNSINIPISYNTLQTSADMKYDLIEKFISIESNYKDYLKNKRVVIVGPADYVDNNDLINEYDVIVRVNKGHSMINTNKHGNRTDVLYHVVNQHEENGGKISEDDSIKHIRFTYPVLDLFDNSTFLNIGTIRDYLEIYHNKKLYDKISNKLSIIEENKYLEFEKLCGSRPNSGLCAILDILSFDIKELYITGFTLFQTNYDISYRETVENNVDTSKQAIDRMNKAKFHNQNNSATVYKNIILKDKRVKYDDKLVKSIDNILRDK
jgi:hypothetical protein